MKKKSCSRGRRPWMCELRKFECRLRTACRLANELRDKLCDCSVRRKEKPGKGKK